MNTLLRFGHGLGQRVSGLGAGIGRHDPFGIAAGRAGEVKVIARADGGRKAESGGKR